jgi:pimeloyl-ACP methyl ester carboxylesterase
VRHLARDVARLTEYLLGESPVLVFLHGVGDGDPGDEWKTRLGATLTHLGYPGLDSLTVVAPKFANALKGADEDETLPRVTVLQPTGEAAKQNRREFERRIGALEFRLGAHDPGNGLLGGDMVVELAAEHPRFVQAQNYLNTPRVRAQVLGRIIRKLPESGEIVLVGHSLGSVIAADLVRRLPAGLKVVGMVTIGSPLASASFDVDELRKTLKEPPANLTWWVNFWNWHDPVSARRGVSSVFPWMIDLRIQTALSPRVHDAVEYLAEDVVAEAIGFALYGSRSRDVARIEHGVDVHLDDTEALSLLALRYAHLTARLLEGDQLARYSGALRQVQATVVQGLLARAAADSRPAPSRIVELAFDYSDARSNLPEPPPARHLSKEAAVVALTVLAAENVIRPFEIEVSRDVEITAMADLTAEMGLGTKFGRDVFAAAKRGHEVVSGKRTVNWIKWGALGVGAAVLVVATGGLAFAAAPGLVGAAAITSALATFGPGGMIGGLVTAGSLVTAGGGGIAYGLAGPGTSAETVETVVERQLAAEILRQMHGLEPDPAVWRNLVETEIEIRRQHERLDEFSDDSASTLKELKRKLIATERALNYLTDNALVPASPSADGSKPTAFVDRDNSRGFMPRRFRVPGIHPGAYSG